MSRLSYDGAMQGTRQTTTGAIEIHHPETLLERLQEIGLSCPQSVTVERFLRVLGEAGLVSHDTARQLVELHLQVVYGGDHTEPERIEEVTSRLVDEATRNAATRPGAVQWVIETLAPMQTEAICSDTQPGSTSSVAPLDQPAGEEMDDEIWPPQPADEDAARDEEQEEAPAAWFDPPWRSGWMGRLSRARRWTLLGGALLIWSLAMVSIGNLGHARITYWLFRLQAQVLDLPPIPRNSRHQVDMLRQRAGEQPTSLTAWRHWANGAQRFGFATDEVVALSRVVSLRPDDAQTLNTLAWLLCTADDPWVRDPVRALELAQRAHALNQAPNITDTLAEAAFQNGDIKRAIALEEDALRRLPETANRAFYERQLRRFKEGLAGETGE